MEKLWTTAEVARFLGINEVDVERLVREGQIVGYKLGGQFLRFRPDQVASLKDKLRFRQNAQSRAIPRSDTWLGQARDFVYFNDFYVISATLLALLVVYLVLSG